MHLFHELLPLYEKQYLKSYFLGIALWCYITAGRNDCGQKCVFKLLYTIFYFFFFFWYSSDLGGVGGWSDWSPQQRKKKKKRGDICVCGQNDYTARPQIAKTLSQLGQPRLEAGQTHS